MRARTPSTSSLLRHVALVAFLAACGSSERPAPYTPIAVGPSGGDISAPKASAPTPAPTPQPTAHVESSKANVPLRHPGDPAPALVATASNGTKIDLADLATTKKNFVVVYFYPKDDTPGCTKEACAFRDAWTKLDKAKIAIIGISEDDDTSHKAFTEKFKLPFPLVADRDRPIAPP